MWQNMQIKYAKNNDFDSDPTINSAGHAYDNDDIVMPQSYADHTMIENTGVHCEKIGEISKNSVDHADFKTPKPLCPNETASDGHVLNLPLN
jgi:hypothetical protein